MMFVFHGYYRGNRKGVVVTIEFDYDKAVFDVPVTKREAKRMLEQVLPCGVKIIRPIEGGWIWHAVPLTK